MSDDDIPASMAEAMAEIRRLRARIAELETEADIKDALTKGLHKWIARLELQAASVFGTLEQPTDDAPFHLEHDVPPSTPR